MSREWQWLREWRRPEKRKVIDMKFKDTELYWFFPRLKFKIEMAWDRFRARCQRFMRGYSYGDVWDMDYWFMETVQPMLFHLRDYGIGIPGSLVVEGENKREAWEAVLTEMIECLNMMNEDYVYEELYGQYWYEEDLGLEDWERVGNVMEKNKTRFFELFSKYFYNLWD